MKKTFLLLLISLGAQKSPLGMVLQAVFLWSQKGGVPQVTLLELRGLLN